MAAEKIGKCCICGTEGELTFEHVPPRAAFNDNRIFEANVQSLMNGKWAVGEKITEGKYAQRGAGRHSLCGKCNNDTGGWYGRAYVQVAKQAMMLLHASNGKMSLAYPYRMWPLRFLKQVVVMFFSACGPSLQDKNPDLVRFVLNRTERQIPRHIHFYAYLHHPTESTVIRQTGLTGVLKGQGNTHVFAEIAFPPFGLILSIDRPPIDTRLCEITHLNEYSYTVSDIVYLKLPVFPVTTWFAGDFRTVDEVNRDVAENRQHESIHLNQPMPSATMS
jgi:hypothetical protein